MSLLIKIDVLLQIPMGVPDGVFRVFGSIFGFAACFGVFKLEKLAVSSCFPCRAGRLEAVLSAL